MAGYRRPGWLTAALEKHSAGASVGRVATSTSAPRPALGQLRVVRSMDLGSAGDRIGLIVGLDEAVGAVTVLLASPFVEQRTSSDYLVEPGESGFAAPLVVECDLRGAVWQAQLERCVGEVPRVLAADLDRVGAGESAAGLGLQQSRFGLPARDGRDPKWGWKLSEREAIDALTAGCERRLLSDEPWAVIVDASYFRERDRLSDATPEAVIGPVGDPDRYDAWMDERAVAAFGDAMTRLDPDGLRASESFINTALNHMCAIDAALEAGVEWLSEEGASANLKAVAAIARQSGWADDCVLFFGTASTSHESGEPAPRGVRIEDRLIQVTRTTIKRAAR